MIRLARLAPKLFPLEFPHLFAVVGAIASLGCSGAVDRIDGDEPPSETTDVGVARQELAAPSKIIIAAPRVIGNGTGQAATVVLGANAFANIDWIQWGSSGTSTNRKSWSPTPLGNWEKLGTGSINQFSGGANPAYPDFRWSEGTPTPTGSTKNGIGTNSVTTTNTGIRFRVPVLVDPRILTVYVTAQDAEFALQVAAFNGVPAQTSTRSVTTRTTFAFDVTLNSSTETSTFASVVLRSKRNTSGFVAVHAAEFKTVPFGVSADISFAIPSSVPQPPLYPVGTLGNRLRVAGTEYRFINVSTNPAPPATNVLGYELWRDGAKVVEASSPVNLSHREVVPGTHFMELVAVSESNARAKIGSSTNAVTYAVAPGPVAIPDFAGGAQCVDVPLQTEFGVQTLVENIDLSFSIAHTYDSDLTIALVSPDNQSITVVDRAGSNNHNFTNTRIHSTSGLGLLNIQDAAAPFSYVFSPANSLTPFRSKFASGLWKLRVCDHAGADAGTIQWVRLYLDPQRPL